MRGFSSLSRNALRFTYNAAMTRCYLQKHRIFVLEVRLRHWFSVMTAASSESSRAFAVHVPARTPAQADERLRLGVRRTVIW